MALDDDIKLLGQLDFFASFTDEQLRLLAFGCQRLQFLQGRELYHHNQMSDGGYVIVSGEIEVSTEESGKRVVLETFGPGSLLGGLGLITRNRRAGTATVVKDAEAIKIRRDTMHRILSEYPELAAAIHDKLVDSISEIGHDLNRIKLEDPQQG